MKFQKKPVVIEAVQWFGWNTVEISDFMENSPVFESDVDGNSWVVIRTLEGDMKASKGDWIIKGVRGEFYPCKPDIFDLTYEAV